MDERTPWGEGRGGPADPRLVDLMLKLLQNMINSFQTLSHDQRDELHHAHSFHADSFHDFKQESEMNCTMLHL